MATWDVMMVDDGLGWTVPASGTTAGSVYASDSWGGGIQAVEPPVLSMHQTAGGCLQAVRPLAVSLHQTAGGGMIAVQPTAGMTHCLCHSPPPTGWDDPGRHTMLFQDGTPPRSTVHSCLMVTHHCRPTRIETAGHQYPLMCFSAVFIILREEVNHHGDAATAQPPTPWPT